MAFELKGGGAISNINVTPLVDVMLVLLIIFMVTATLVRVQEEQERRVDMNLPATQTEPPTEPQDQEKLILRINSRLEVLLGEEPLVDCSAALGSTERDRFERCFGDIQERIGQNERGAAQETVYVLADVQVPYGFVVGVLHRIRLAGVERVGMVTNPEFLPLVRGEDGARR